MPVRVLEAGLTLLCFYLENKGNYCGFLIKSAREITHVIRDVRLVTEHSKCNIPSLRIQSILSLCVRIMFKNDQWWYFRTIYVG
jgi:hypothetical protein